ncbi:MAG TPA: sugar ABC transporter permease, partial [Alphaproteobacteria bacterium]|nr:sugar ABC transporter permease [Alphaproteobacteria bacterium]
MPTAGADYAPPIALIRGGSEGRRRTGRILFWSASGLLVLVALLQSLDAAAVLHIGFDNWQPMLFTYVVWGVALGIRQVLVHGERGWRALFVLPAALFTVAMVVFPLIFGLSLSVTD